MIRKRRKRIWNIRTEGENMPDIRTIEKAKNGETGTTYLKVTAKGVTGAVK